MDQAEGGIPSLLPSSPSLTPLGTNMEMLVDLLAKIQTQPRHVTYEQFEHRVQLLELMIEDSDLVNQLQEPGFRDRVIGAYREAWSFLESHRALVETEPNLVARITNLEHRGELVF